MLCEKCSQRPATVHVAEINNGQKQETHLCELCAKEIQIHGFGVFPANEYEYFFSWFIKL